MPSFDEIAQTLIDGDMPRATSLTRAAVKGGTPAIEVLNKGLLPGMKVVGERFRSGEFFLPEVLLAGEAMKAAMAELRPALQREGARSRGKVAIGTVKDDIHDIGKNLVIMMLQGNGWEVSDLGIDVPTEEFVSVVRERELDILGLSALLTTTMPRLKEILDALEAAGLRNKVKIMVGGVPVTQAYADEIGADGYAANAVEAVDKADRLVKRR